MSGETLPCTTDFSARYKLEQPQLVYRRVVNDIDTPVSAYIKIALGQPYAFLFESVQGGEQRGRYSFLGFSPDIVWRSHGDSSDIARGADIKAKRFTPLSGKPLETLRALQAQSAFDLPEDIPPMAAGLFGYLGYDMIRQVENLPGINADPIGTPDAIMVRPTIVAIFDLIAQEVILATAVYPNDKSASAAYTSALKRLDIVELEMAKPTTSLAVSTQNTPTLSPTLGTTESAFSARVKKAKEYILAGDVFQVVIGQRLSSPIPASPLAFYRSLRRMNPSPFLYILNFDDHSIVGSSPEILVRSRDGIVTVRPIAGTRPRGKTKAEDIKHENDLLADPKECAEHLMLLDLGRNDVGRVSKPGTVTVTERFTIERYSHVMHIVSNVEGELKEAVSYTHLTLPTKRIV